MGLPFLNNSKWPTSKEPEERVVNPSSDKQLQDHLMGELLVALEHRNPMALKESILAIIHAIRNEEQDEAASET